MFLSLHTVKEISGLIVLLASVLAVLYRPSKFLYNKAILNYKEWRDFTVNINRTIKLVEELYPVVIKLNEDLKPNGGSSLRDAIDRIDNRVWLSEQRLRYFAEHPGPISFETDADGNTIWVSKGWQEVYGIEYNDAIGRGWINGVFFEDRDEVVKEWYAAVQDKRRFSMSYRVNNDQPVLVFCESYPLVSPKGKVIGWLGYVIKKN